jgi:hypothetical protein
MALNESGTLSRTRGDLSQARACHQQALGPGPPDRHRAGGSTRAGRPGPVRLGRRPHRRGRRQATAGTGDLPVDRRGLSRRRVCRTGRAARNAGSGLNLPWIEAVLCEQRRSGINQAVASRTLTRPPMSKGPTPVEAMRESQSTRGTRSVRPGQGMFRDSRSGPALALRHQSTGAEIRRPPGRGGPPQFPPPLSVRSAPPMPGSPSPTWAADTKTLHCPTRIRWRLSVLTFRLTSR